MTQPGMMELTDTSSSAIAAEFLRARRRAGSQVLRMPAAPRDFWFATASGLQSQPKATLGVG